MAECITAIVNVKVFSYICTLKFKIPMKKYPKETDYFLDMDAEFAEEENARYVLMEVPYDGTSTFVKGADQGPRAIIEASDSLELYDVAYGIEAYQSGIYTDKPTLDFSTPEKMVESVYERAKYFMSRGKMLGLLGGEHSVSAGAIRAAKEKYGELSVLQIDAHADLRDEYHGSPYNHACVMRRAQEMGANVVQVGIRNVCAEEKCHIVAENTFYAHQIATQNDSWMLRACDQLTDNVYLTIDLDGLDPSILPATGTPLPGGLGWYQLLRFLDIIAQQKNIVAFDVVELCPQPDNVVSDVLAATLVYKIITMLEAKR